MLFTIMGIIVLIAVGVVGLLIFLLNKEGHKEVKEVIPVVDLSVFKTDLMAPTQVQTSLIEETYKKKVVDLEDELRQVSDKAVAQAQEALTMIDQLKKQHEDVEEEKGRLQEEYDTKLKEAGGHLTQLQADNGILQVQLNNSRDKILVLEDEIVAVKKQMEIEIARANAQLEQIAKEKEDAVAEGISFQLAAMKSAQEALTQANADLQKNNQELKESLAAMTTKNDLMQYEMVKYRAQASGLERMCANYKEQLEGLLSKDAAS